ncbi:conserved virulence factor C family protein [Melghirimyces algeriensis]|uniref:HEAT repeat-containing protein n=1 Tax=Melghirimyces algeriensis TaxID=910412 RepID=A0A521D4Y1_9BACL|nr:conserved virulence factor C family protein [Melghirimyces algeriensis]SMO66151.1 HEAT repeat-containing protein [Melghirimyces algeriensis]
MKLHSIEPTPSPNTMKLNIDEKATQAKTYTPDHLEDAPEIIRQLLQIEGVKSVFRVADFISVERNPRADWKEILSGVREVFGLDENEHNHRQPVDSISTEAFGEVKVYLQTFRGIPIQLKLSRDDEEKRVALPERFSEAVMEAQKASPNMVMERRWEELGVRYGELDELGQEVTEEISASYDPKRLENLVQQALLQESDSPAPERRPKMKVTLDMLDHPDWKKRYALLEQMNPTLDDLDVLDKALNDPKPMIRRLATAYLGMIGDAKVLPSLYRALKDPSVTVRRTAGDCLSDIGDPDAIGPMIESLKDKSKLVRWRAAMFLYETGDESALPALREAQADPEFEVSMQVKMALERIERGEEASGSVWKQMTRRNEGDSDF